MANDVYNFDPCVFQGTGKKKFEKLLKSMEEKYPGKVRAVVKFNAPLAHLIMAGADVLAVPSRFEPCGLIQLQGMRYGTPFACASTGGLVDTVIEGKTGFHMGRLSVDVSMVAGYMVFLAVQGGGAKRREEGGGHPEARHQGRRHAGVRGDGQELHEPGPLLSDADDD